MATGSDNYSPLHDKFWLAMQITENLSRIKRATSTDELCRTSGDSISNCLCNFREIIIKSCRNVHMIASASRIGMDVLAGEDYSKPIVNELQLA